LKVNIYRVTYFVSTDVDGTEVRRVSPKTMLVAAKDHNEAAGLLPNTPVENRGERNRNIVITCQSIHTGVLAAERKSLDEELAETEAT
jgi:hypothetical protein